MTSKSKDDLNLKDGQVDEVITHKNPHSKKSAIKRFNLDVNQLTGIPNFTQLSKDPLKIPKYALEISNQT